MCELCELKTIEEEFYRDNDFVIISCMSCHVPMVVPFEHIDPKEGGSPYLREKMENMLMKVAVRFFKEKEFFIDKEEKTIFDHMHWHAREKGKDYGNLELRNR